MGPEDRLDSWKAIAAYFARGVRTVQRREQDEGLPVHRLTHEKRGSVNTSRREVDAWWKADDGRGLHLAPFAPTCRRVDDVTASRRIKERSRGQSRLNFKRL